MRQIVREGIDYATPVGKLVTQLLASVAEMERNIIVERTKAGLEAARKKGNHGGRPIRLSSDIKDSAIRLVLEGGYSIRKASNKVGMSHCYLSKLIQKFKLTA